MVDAGRGGDEILEAGRVQFGAGHVEAVPRFTVVRSVGQSRRRRSLATCERNAAAGPLHGVAARVDPNAAAFPHPREGFAVLLIGQWQDPADNAVNIPWVRDTFEAPPAAPR